MINESNAAERLKSFIEAKGLSNSQFADSCGIPRPSLSQFLTGRNKKMSDVMVGQIHNTFPELSVVWLLFGEGAMENNPSIGNLHPGGSFTSEVGENNFDSQNKVKLESKKIVFSSNNGNRSEFSKENDLKPVENSSQYTDYEVEKLQNKLKDLQTKIDNLTKNPRKAVRITVYYDDSTFEEFIPGV